MTIEDMRNHIDKFIAELQTTRFANGYDGSLQVVWIDDPERAVDRGFNPTGRAVQLAGLFGQVSRLQS